MTSAASLRQEYVGAWQGQKEGIFDGR